MPFRAVGRIFLGWVRSRERRKRERLGWGGGGGWRSGGIFPREMLKNQFAEVRFSCIPRVISTLPPRLSGPLRRARGCGWDAYIAPPCLRPSPFRRCFPLPFPTLRLEKSSLKTVLTGAEPFRIVHYRENPIGI